ncbi:glutamate--tRNA ligase [Thermofilum pendens]|uniref:Glutamate--tRNA ligase n=1 Tax=Thermofilum pendens (strain DSM 2475 / Hrk 5) TaxID=368408 RepID=SYE_THEPD|nr:glutamate--tRNA ligase [Thermofilum pendens]A1RYD7.1 RecName: Full=Glutamate--tRNA ligase; AltName: Full=Glutamyl-tRNA synthetase; Short=GluRS [Thermofilum pendens Hrk 5]ABL78217.1 glutamyl-tRNA synthetase [Thermofilum pendens Hrk 5]
MEVDIRRVALKHALANAVKFGGKARVDSVVSKVFAEVPEARKAAKEVVELVKEVVEEVNSMSPESQASLLSELWPEALSGERKVEVKRLPPLPGAEEVGGKVVTRFAPNPDFVLHLGSARPAILNYYYAKKMYNGKFILRFEDTDPRTKRPMPEAYDLIREDLRWLGTPWDEEYIQSQRMEVYYEVAEALIKSGNAYVCTHSQDEIKAFRDAGKPDPCSFLPPEEHMERWEKMLSGEYPEGAAVLRIKTDPAHPNPSVRDWIAFRVLDTEKTPHPLTGDKYRVWPTYNFACAVDDHMLGVTHVLRGEEHAVNTLKQEYVYRHMGWKPPVSIHFGRMNLEGMVLSKSVIRRGIEKGLFSSIDDIRLGTLRALRRRGILPEAIWDLVLEVGIKPSTARVSVDKLHAFNRKYLEPRANRYMFVPEPAKVASIEGLEAPITAEVIVHPSFPERGRRRITFSKPEVYLPSDVASSMVRLMGLGNFEVVDGGSKLRYLNNDVSFAKKHELPIVQWAPVESSVRGRVLKAAGTKIEEISGYGEPSLAELPPGEQVQFVRLGFVRVEGPETYIFTHD